VCVLAGMNLLVLTLYPLIPLEAVTIADKSLDFFIEPLHLGQVFDSDIIRHFIFESIKRFHIKMKGLSINVLNTCFLTLKTVHTFTPDFGRP